MLRPCIPHGRARTIPHLTRAWAVFKNDPGAVHALHIPCTPHVSQTQAMWRWLHTRGLALQTLIMRAACEKWPQRGTFGTAGDGGEKASRPGGDGAGASRITSPTRAFQAMCPLSHPARPPHACGCRLRRRGGHRSLSAGTLLDIGVISPCVVAVIPGEWCRRRLDRQLR
jgi:hypothetical protein